MKIIHTADLHLDSSLSRHLGDERAKERRNELLVTFQKMVKYAADEDVSAIIIAGDLFDTRRISATARNAVVTTVQDHPYITFYYLRGNHDAGSFIDDVVKKFGALPENLLLFGDEWKTYELSNGEESVTITGAELSADNNMQLVSSLVLDQNKMNIVTLHGQEVYSALKKDAEVIPIKDYRNRGIDYMALGHIHSPSIEKLDSRGVYSYSGCLEGRGFDECGPRGFNMLTITRNETGVQKLEVEFIPFASRVLHEIRVDVSECETSDDAVKKIRDEVQERTVISDDLLRVLLVGEVSVEADIDADYIKKNLDNDYYLVQVKDKTKTFVDFAGFAGDMTLKGEFVRMIQEEQTSGNLTDDEAAEIIKTGIMLLAGEEVLK